MNKTHTKLLTSILAIALLGSFAALGATSATAAPAPSAAPVELSTPTAENTWYVRGDAGDANRASEQTESGYSNLCYSTASSNNYLGQATATAASADSSVTAISYTFLLPEHFANEEKTAEFDFSTLPCADDWSLSGTWSFTNESGVTRTGEGGTIPVQLADISVGDPESDEGNQDVENDQSYALQRLDGTWISGAFNPIYPSISAAPFERTMTLGESLTITPSELSADCSISVPEVACDPAVSVTTLPEGAVLDEGGSVVFTPTKAGTFSLNYVLSDSERSLTTQATGTIVVSAPAVPEAKPVPEATPTPESAPQPSAAPVAPVPAPEVPAVVKPKVTG
ncbi:hypothetical protein [Frigoribacterium sp. 9N]|uniref:hypothetical protein n=1 Tax=Frigoribacterium sp. 9N TaxID=2653144 RepID=UPI0012F4190F|nr:hypothetical protein [Frigoribacterium sp. 9N]VXB75486.1 exported hypothetical protein [Frigoribacterium sp. 9N]